MEKSSFPLDFCEQLLDELTGNILPFWMHHAPDEVNGGFYGAVTNDLKIDNRAPRSTVLCARIVWAFSAAYRKFGRESYLQLARRAFDYLTTVFWDREHRGVYWSVDKRGQPVSDRKHHYAQAFALYGISEYYRATDDPHSLAYAQELFHLIERHGYDGEHGGYFEGRSRDWGMMEDMRLGEGDMNSPKSMNTMLHLLESYTNLYRIWTDELLRERLEGMLVVFLTHIFDSETGHLKMFFDERWGSLSSLQSFGHDIEASWLICEAADVLDDPQLTKQAQRVAVRLADSVLSGGMHPAGDVVLEGTVDGSSSLELISWWSQVEGMVGFLNACQITGREEYAGAVLRLWAFIRDHFIDRERGGWFKNIPLSGSPDKDGYKIGPWEGPYHHVRACLEIVERLSGDHTQI